jgi:hypothetical protein
MRLADRRQILGHVLILPAVFAGAICPKAADLPEGSKGGGINVREFGAKGDGATDDTASFLQAIQILNMGKAKRLFIPWGRYRLSQTITVSQPGCIVQGESSELNFAGNRYNSVDIPAHGKIRPCLHVNQRNCYVADLSISGRESSASCGLLCYASDLAAHPKDLTWGRLALERLTLLDTGSLGVLVHQAEHARLVSVWVLRSGNTAVKFSDCSWSELENCRAMQSNGVGFHFRSCSFVSGTNVEALENENFQIVIDRSKYVRLVFPDCEADGRKRPNLRSILVYKSYASEFIGGHYSHIGSLLLAFNSRRTSVEWPSVGEDKALIAQDGITGLRVASGKMRANYGDLAQDPELAVFLDEALRVSNGMSPPIAISDVISTQTCDVHIDRSIVKGFGKTVMTLAPAQ